MYKKNGWPWAGILNTKLKASNYLVDKMISCWNATNWGYSFENYRRPTYQRSIYTSTRARQMPNTTPDEALIELTHLAYNEVKSLFSENDCDNFFSRSLKYSFVIVNVFFYLLTNFYAQNNYLIAYDSKINYEHKLCLILFEHYLFCSLF